MKWDILYWTIEHCGKPNWQPQFVKFTSYFYHNLITIHEWMYGIALINSDNIPLGECVLHNLPGVNL